MCSLWLLCAHLQNDRLRLGQTVLETSSTSEGATTNGSDDGEHESEDDPADPTEGLGGSEGIAVEVSLVAAAARELVRESGGSGEPEDPSEEEPDTVAGNGSDDAADARQEEGGVDNGEDECPPGGEDEEVDLGDEGLRVKVVLTLVVVL